MLLFELAIGGRDATFCLACQHDVETHTCVSRQNDIVQRRDAKCCVSTSFRYRSSVSFNDETQICVSTSFRYRSSVSFNDETQICVSTSFRYRSSVSFNDETQNVASLHRSANRKANTASKMKRCHNPKAVAPQEGQHWLISLKQPTTNNQQPTTNNQQPTT
jgi:hypothetical protein